MPATATPVRSTPLVGSAIGYSAHLHRGGRQAESDDDDDRAHERRREQLVEPPGAERLHDAGDDHVHDAGDDETAKGGGDIASPRHGGRPTAYGDDRRDEREARPQVARDLVAHADEVQDRADARGHQADTGVESGQDAAPGRWPRTWP